MKSFPIFKLFFCLCLMVTGAAQAAPGTHIVDLSTFSGSQGRPGNLLITPNYISLWEIANAGGYVKDLVSFTWSGDSLPGGATVTTTFGKDELPPGFFQPETVYSFKTPYTGFISFAVDYGFGSYSGIAITNLTAVPEPATYGMFLAGLGIVGALAQRRRKS
ncbi:FxDxF family PEP-CTERM protein [Duganella sp. PWIR1]